MAEVVDKYPKCATCIYATLSTRGNPLCTLHRDKRHKCQDYMRPETLRYEFSYEGYRFIFIQRHFYSTEAKAVLYLPIMNVYLEPYKKTKKGKRIRVASLAPLSEPRSNEELKRIAIEDFVSSNIGKRNLA